jgi:hypothetical protein
MAPITARRKSCNRTAWPIGGAIGQPLPLACQDWAGTKTAYRFFSNERFGEDAIVSGHLAARAARSATAKGPLLVVQDTTEYNYTWANSIGPQGAGRPYHRAGARAQSKMSPQVRPSPRT